MKFLLIPFFFAYRLGSQIKNLFYSCGIFKAKKGEIYTVSVGNITFGGSEKTPIAMHLASYLTGQGFKPAFISRGYRGNWERKGGTLSDGEHLYGDWRDSGDEPFMVAQRYPGIGVFIGKNRLASCKKARELGFRSGILDDGFQHRRLKRDLDIVVYNPSEGIALREPISSLKRAQMILIKDDPLDLEKIREQFSQASLFMYSVLKKGFFRSGENKQISPDELRRKKLMAFCGIAHPERFLSSLEEESIKPAMFLTFQDHHRYPLSSQRKILEDYRRSNSEALITTEKDSVKISSMKEIVSLPVYYLKIEIELEESFYSSLLSYFKG